MLEPLSIPTTPRERALILKQCSLSAAYRMAVLNRCREDKVFFCNAFVWVQEPRSPEEPDDEDDEGLPLEASLAAKSRPAIPLFLDDYQVDILNRLMRAIEKREDLYIEKARDMGATWVLVAAAVWQWLFRPGTQILLGSRKEQLVDDRTIRSLFGKIDHIMGRLPGWMLPPGWRQNRDRTNLRLVNPNTLDPEVRGNTIRGESSNEDFGTGDRCTWMLYDEAAKWPNFAAAWRSGGLTTYTRVGVSSPKGMNAWGKLINLPAVKPFKLTLPWYVNPRHTKEWYAAMCRRLILQEDIDQELNLSYTATRTGVVYPTWVNCQFGVYEYEKSWTTFVSWDAGLDTTALIWWQRDPMAGQVRMLDCYANKNKAISFYAPFVTGIITGDNPHLKEYSLADIDKIMAHAAWGAVPLNFGDPSLRARSVSDGTSPLEVLKKLGVSVHTRPDARDFGSRYRFTVELLKGLQVNLGEPGGAVSCLPVDDAMRNARFPEKRQDSQSTSTNPLPVHDDTSHFRSSIEYFAVCVPAYRHTRRPVGDAQRASYEALGV